MKQNLFELLTKANGLLSEAKAEQFKQPPYVASTPVGGAKNNVSDTTSQVALDPKRLRLRAAVLAAERVINEVTEEIKKTNENLIKAIDSFESTH